LVCLNQLHAEQLGDRLQVSARFGHLLGRLVTK
jgi:hypothetical protein